MPKKINTETNYKFLKTFYNLKHNDLFLIYFDEKNYILNVYNYFILDYSLLFFIHNAEAQRK